MMSSSLFTAIPLSESHLKNVFENTSNLSRLCRTLNIPDDKSTTAGAVEYYRRSADPRKMRKMVWCLDFIIDTALADSVMERAEPPAGMCILLHLVCDVHRRCSPHFILTICDPLFEKIQFCANKKYSCVDEVLNLYNVVLPP